MKPKTYRNCIRCGKPKSKPPAVSGKMTAKNYVSPLVYQRDPYCSRSCCEAEYAEVKGLA